MSSTFGKAMVIANPKSGRGKVGKSSSWIPDLLNGAGIEHELRLTSGPGDAADIARRAIKDGTTYLIAVGGDGTIHEVVNGMMGSDGPLNRDAVLGIIAAGSGSDFIRTFGLPPAPEDAIKHLTGDGIFEVDVGKVTYTDGDKEKSEFFPNISEAGFGADVARRAERLPRFLGRIRYLLSFWITLSAFSIEEGTVDLDGRIYEGTITNLVVANGQFFGGGMKIAPKAHPGDGKFDVLVQKGNKRDYVAGITKVFKGEHVPSPVIGEYLASTVKVTSKKPLRIEADGEILGTTPATFQLIPGALKIKI